MDSPSLETKNFDNARAGPAEFTHSISRDLDEDDGGDIESTPEQGRMFSEQS